MESSIRFLNSLQKGGNLLKSVKSGPPRPRKSEKIDFRAVQKSVKQALLQCQVPFPIAKKMRKPCENKHIPPGQTKTELCGDTRNLTVRWETL